MESSESHIFCILGLHSVSERWCADCGVCSVFCVLRAESVESVESVQSVQCQMATESGGRHLLIDVLMV